MEQARSAGLRADIDVDVDGAAVPAAIGGAAFRIVQEALTNVLRHANASSAHVSVRAYPNELDIDVTDDGHVELPGSTPGLFSAACSSALRHSAAASTSAPASKVAGAFTPCFR